MPPTWHGAKNITFFGNTPLLLCSFKWGLLYHSSALQGKMTTYKGWPIQATPHRSVHPSICWNSASIHGKISNNGCPRSHLKTNENKTGVIIKTVLHKEGMGCPHIPCSLLQDAIFFTNYPFKIRSVSVLTECPLSQMTSMSIVNPAFPSTTKLPLVARTLLRIKQDISMMTGAIPRFLIPHQNILCV